MSLVMFCNKCGAKIDRERHYKVDVESWGPGPGHLENGSLSEICAKCVRPILEFIAARAA